MKRIAIYLLFCLWLPTTLLSQGENNVWHFGIGAVVDFNSGVPVDISSTAGSLIGTNEGCASVCNAAGTLLFYTDGITIWSRNNLPMPGANGNLLGNPSSTQSAIIVPKPGSSTIYYVFTADQGGYGGPNLGVFYSIVDMTLNGGFGDVTSINTVLLAPPATEKLTACRHANCTDYWIITHSFLDNQFQAFQLSASGVSAPVLSNSGSPHLNTSTFFNETIGYMKVSPDRRRLALALYGLSSFAEVFDFDNATGIVSNPITFNYPLADGVDAAYGVSFSPNSEILYVGYFGANLNSVLYQYDLLAPTPAAVVASELSIISIPGGTFGCLQLGPDDKLYITRSGMALDVVPNPNTLGLGCGYQVSGVPLTAQTTFGLPNRIEGPDGGAPPVTLGGDVVVCGGAINVTLSTTLPGTYQWSTGSTASSIVVTQPGQYVLTVNDTVCQSTSSDTVVVSRIDGDLYPASLFSCDSAITLESPSPTPGNTTFLWNTGATTPTIQVNASGTYYVTLTTGSCSLTDTIQVDFGQSGSVRPINVFSPNESGINDWFGFPTAATDGYRLEVYNRWGRLLFTSNEPQQMWNGKVDDLPAPDGVYYWLLRTTDCLGNPEDKSGFVTLIR